VSRFSFPDAGRAKPRLRDTHHPVAPPREEGVGQKSPGADWHKGASGPFQISMKCGTIGFWLQ
jgi:hypothetical protein